MVLTCSLLYLVWHRFPCIIAIIASCKFKTNSLKMVVQFRELDTLYEFELIRTIHWPSIFGRWDDFQKLLKNDINKTWFPGFHNFLAPRRWATWGHYGSLLQCDADRCPLLKGPLSLSSGGEIWLFTQGFDDLHILKSKDYFFRFNHSGVFWKKLWVDIPQVEQLDSLHIRGEIYRSWKLHWNVLFPEWLQEQSSHR